MAKKDDRDIETEHRFTVIEQWKDATTKRLDGWECLAKRIMMKLLALFAATIVTGLTLGLHSEHVMKAWKDLWGGK